MKKIGYLGTKYVTSVYTTNFSSWQLAIDATISASFTSLNRCPVWLEKYNYTFINDYYQVIKSNGKNDSNGQLYSS